MRTPSQSGEKKSLKVANLRDTTTIQEKKRNTKKKMALQKWRGKGEEKQRVGGVPMGLWEKIFGKQHWNTHFRKGKSMIEGGTE